jgi:hypothetical protein
MANPMLSQQEKVRPGRNQDELFEIFTKFSQSGSNELGSATALGVTVLFVHSMLSARCFSLNRLVAATLPQVGINDKKKCFKPF